MKALGERLSLALRAGGLGEEDLFVLSVEGREALSEPYAFDVVFHPASGDPLDPPSFLREEAVLALRRPTGEERYVHGECVRVQLVEVAAGKPIYRLRIGPKLLRLSHAVRCRIFQEKSVPEIVRGILDEHQVDAEVSLSGSHPAREYVTQYEESDLAFVTRLLAEEGIWFRFDHVEGGHTAVLGDATSALVEAPAVPQRIRGDQGEGRAASPGSSRATPSRATSPPGGTSTSSSRAPISPRTRARATSRSTSIRPATRWRGRDDGSRASASRSFRSARRPSPARPTRSRSSPARRSRLRTVRPSRWCASRTGVGRSGRRPAEGRAPAGRARSTGSPRTARTGRRAARGRGWGSRRRPSRGRPARNVHVDRHGRIKVQLHWDRKGQRNERSSCWMRVAQAWAGAGMGASRVPRIGQEVLVRWLEGDPDRPLVTGAVFNGANPTPVVLPDDKTRSVLRTDTSPGSGGSNELTFEDAAGSEEVFLHAQKDWNGAVEADRTEDVQHDAALEVMKDRSRTVMGAQHHAVGGGEAAKVDGNVTLTVAAARTAVVATGDDESVGSTRVVTVASTRTVSVLAASAETVGGAAALTIGGAYAVSVGGAINHAVGGLKNTAVGGASVEVVGLSRQETIGKKRSGRTQGDFAIEVKGGVTLLTTKDGDEQVDGKVEIEVKEALVILCKDGKLEADKITVVVGGEDRARPAEVGRREVRRGRDDGEGLRDPQDEGVEGEDGVRLLRRERLRDGGRAPGPRPREEDREGELQGQEGRPGPRRREVQAEDAGGRQAGRGGRVGRHLGGRFQARQVRARADRASTRTRTGRRGWPTSPRSWSGRRS